MRALVILLLLALASPAAAQTVLNPFSLWAGSAHGTVAAGDDPRITGAVQSNGDASTTTVRPSGASVARTLAQRAGDVFNVLDYGGDPTGVGDLGAVLNAIAAKLSATSANVIDIPPGHYTLATAVSFTGVAPVLRGHGFTAGPGATGSSGTWITIAPASPTGFVPFTISGTNARGTVIRDIAFTETQPAPGTGWAPAAYGAVFDVVNTLGEVTFDNVLFAGVTKGIYADNSGRLDIKDVRGQFFSSAVEIDDCYDIPRIERLHAWPYWTSNTAVIAWQEANENTVLLHRVDGIFIDNLFSLGAYAALHLTSGVNGVTTKAYVGNLYADFTNYGVLVDGAGSDAQIANMTSQGNDQTLPANTLPNSDGLWVNTTGVTLQLGNFYSKLTAGPAIEVDGSSNRVAVANFRANTYGTPGAGTEAIHVADSGSQASNNVFVGNKEHLQGVSPLVLFNTGSNGGRERFMMLNDVGGANGNEPRGYAGSAGGGPASVAAIGGDASIDLQLQAKSVTGSVRLQSNGQTVLRTDDASSGVDDGLLRSGAGSLNWIAEGGDANVDWYWIAKGTTGGVRLQANGLTTLRTDNPNGGDSDVLVRPGTGAANLIAESASASADIDLAGKGSAGGIRLQANGSSTLRTDNPNAVADDLLLRPATGTLSLTAEGSDANVNIVLTPKGSGTVVVPTMGCTDNATNVASTAFVKACAPGSSGSVGSFNGRAGSVTLTQTDVVTALSFTPYSAANPSNFIAAAGAPVQSVAGRSGTITLAVGDVAGAAPTASPALTGTPTAPTNAMAADGSTQLATDAFVQAAIGANPGGFVTATTAPVRSVAGRAGAITLGVGDVAGAAPSASPALTGTPTAPTNATAADGSTQLATDAFVQAAIGANPGGFVTATTAPVQTVNSIHPASANVVLQASDVGAAPEAQVQAAINGVTALSVTGGSLTLSAAQAATAMQTVSGALTANQTLVVPNAGQWLVENLTTGSYTLTVGTASGSGCQVPQGNALLVMADGVNAVCAGASVAAVTATLNSNVGTCGSAASIPSVTLNARGQATGCTTNALAVANVAGAAPATGAALTGATTVSVAGTANSFKAIGAQPGGSGFARAGRYLLVGASSSTASLRLTTDGNAPGAANCIDLASGSTLSAYIDFTGRDTSSTIAARYRALDILVDTRASAGTTQMANAVSGVSSNGNLGTVTGLTFSVGADATNGCLAISVVPPNADTWHWAARVETTEVQ